MMEENNSGEPDSRPGLKVNRHPGEGQSDSGDNISKSSSMEFAPTLMNIYDALATSSETTAEKKGEQKRREKLEDRPFSFCSTSSVLSSSSEESHISRSSGIGTNDEECKSGDDLQLEKRRERASSRDNLENATVTIMVTGEGEATTTGNSHGGEIVPSVVQSTDIKPEASEVRTSGDQSQHSMGETALPLDSSGNELKSPKAVEAMEMCNDETDSAKLLQRSTVTDELTNEKKEKSNTLVGEITRSELTEKQLAAHEKVDPNSKKSAKKTEKRKQSSTLGLPSLIGRSRSDETSTLPAKPSYAENGTGEKSSSPNKKKPGKSPGVKSQTMGSGKKSSIPHSVEANRIRHGEYSQRMQRVSRTMSQPRMPRQGVTPEKGPASGEPEGPFPGGPLVTNHLTPNLTPVHSRKLFNQPGLTHIDKVVIEILLTEKNYVRDLNQVIEGYLEAILDHDELPIDPEDFNSLFGNIEDIYHFNKELLEELEDCENDPVQIADCFVDKDRGFRVYTNYCTNYPQAVAVLTKCNADPVMSDFFRQCQATLKHGLALGSYLLKPVQRILKYRLLFLSICENYDKTKEGYEVIHEAFQTMTHIARYINDMKRKHEAAVRVQEIQSQLVGFEENLTTYGELVLEDNTFKMPGKRADRYLCLLDKVLLIGKKREDGTIIIKFFILCSNMMLLEQVPKEPLCFHVIPFDNPKIEYSIQAKTLEQKHKWTHQLKRLILENHTAAVPIKAKLVILRASRDRSNLDNSDGLDDEILEPNWEKDLEERKSKRHLRRKSESAIKLHRGAKQLKEEEYTAQGMKKPDMTHPKSGSKYEKIVEDETDTQESESESPSRHSSQASDKDGGPGEATVVRKPTMTRCMSKSLDELETSQAQNRKASMGAEDSEEIEATVKAVFESLKREESLRRQESQKRRNVTAPNAAASEVSENQTTSIQGATNQVAGTRVMRKESNRGWRSVRRRGSEGNILDSSLEELQTDARGRQQLGPVADIGQEQKEGTPVALQNGSVGGYAPVDKTVRRLQNLRPGCLNRRKTIGLMDTMLSMGGEEEEGVAYPQTNSICEENSEDDLDDNRGAANPTQAQSGPKSRPPPRKLGTSQLPKEFHSSPNVAVNSGFSLPTIRHRKLHGSKEDALDLTKGLSATLSTDAGDGGLGAIWVKRPSDEDLASPTRSKSFSVLSPPSPSSTPTIQPSPGSSPSSSQSSLLPTLEAPAERNSPRTTTAKLSPNSGSWPSPRSSSPSTRKLSPPLSTPPALDRVFEIDLETSPPVARREGGRVNQAARKKHHSGDDLLDSALYTHLKQPVTRCRSDGDQIMNSAADANPASHGLVSRQDSSTSSQVSSEARDSSSSDGASQKRKSNSFLSAALTNLGSKLSKGRGSPGNDHERASGDLSDSPPESKGLNDVELEKRSSVRVTDLARQYGKKIKEHAGGLKQRVSRKVSGGNESSPAATLEGGSNVNEAPLLMPAGPSTIGARYASYEKISPSALDANPDDVPDNRESPKVGQGSPKVVGQASPKAGQMLGNPGASILARLKSIEERSAFQRRSTASLEASTAVTSLKERKAQLEQAVSKPIPTSSAMSEIHSLSDLSDASSVSSSYRDCWEFESDFSQSSSPRCDSPFLGQAPMAGSKVGRSLTDIKKELKVAASKPIPKLDPRADIGLSIAQGQQSEFTNDDGIVSGVGDFALEMEMYFSEGRLGEGKGYQSGSELDNTLVENSSSGFGKGNLMSQISDLTDQSGSYRTPNSSLESMADEVLELAEKPEAESNVEVEANDDYLDFEERDVVEL